MPPIYLTSDLLSYKRKPNLFNPVKKTVNSDPYFDNVVLYLKGDGTNGSTAIVDESPTPKAISVFGNTNISTAQSKYGGSSIYFDRSGDYLSIPDSVDLGFESGDFTVEAWVHPTLYSSNNAGSYVSAIFAKDRNFGRSWSFSMRGTPDSYTTLHFLSFNGGVQKEFGADATFILNTWYHVAASRVNGTLYLFVNGALIGSTIYNHSVDTTNVDLHVGANNYDSTYTYYYPGYIDSARITKGVARYAANFDPETDTYLSY